MTQGTPLSVFERKLQVPQAWVDYNGHMGDFAYAIAFSETVTAFMAMIGLGAEYRTATQATLYTLDMRIGYTKECHQGDVVSLTLDVLAVDAKRMHLYLSMHDEAGARLAWSSQVLLHVTQAGETPKSAPFPADIRQKLEAFATKGAALRPLISEIDRPLGL